MSNGRRYNKKRVADSCPPKWVLDAAVRVGCPDCDSSVVVRHHVDGRWDLQVGHDDGCVQLTFRQRNGMTASAVMVSTNDQPLSPHEVMAMAAEVAAGTGADGVRVSSESALSWAEREAIERREP